MGSPARAGDEDEVATILEFFGIKLTTPNERLATFFKQDVGGIFHADLSSLRGGSRGVASRDGTAKEEP